MKADENDIASETAGAYGIGGKNYTSISLMSFVVVVILSLLINAAVTIVILATDAAPLALVWIIFVGAIFIYTYRGVGRTGKGAGTAYLFIFSSTLFIGFLIGIGLDVFGAGSISIMSGLVGVAIAYFRLQGIGMI